MADFHGRIRVFCRIRPLSVKEMHSNQDVVVEARSQYEVWFNDASDKEIVNEYDSVFGLEASQDDVFEDAKRLVMSAVDGYNVCIFAYGATGSGKTFTIQGKNENPGICMRVLKELFEIRDRLHDSQSNEIRIRSYMVELYLDKLNDLFWLRQQIELGNKRQNLKFPKVEIKGTSDNQVILRGAVEIELDNYEDAIELYLQSIYHRKQAATNYNQHSSRSHLVFSIIVENENLETKERTTGKISLVDLAGSENLKNEESKERKEEGIKVNQSLSALKNVIAKLTEKEKHIPYNDNLLTKLMRDSLGGTNKTLMIVSAI